jgi:hypothetical protein
MDLLKELIEEIIDNPEVQAMEQEDFEQFLRELCSALMIYAEC